MQQTPKRLILVGDTHAGIHPNAHGKWTQIHRDYFGNFLIPWLKVNARPGDALVHLGDVFDHQSHLNILTLHEVVAVFAQIRNMLPVYVLVGNHDQYEVAGVVHSLCALSHMAGVEVIDKPTRIAVAGDKQIGLMAYDRNPQRDAEAIAALRGCDYLFCHADIQGAKLNARQLNTHGLTLGEYAPFRHVFAGHIHLRQVQSNFTYVGSAYAMTSADEGNQKGIHVLDLETTKVDFIPNIVSPVYRTLEINSVEDLGTVESRFGEVKNDFITLSVNKDTVGDLRMWSARLREIQETFSDLRVNYQHVKPTETGKVVLHPGTHQTIGKEVVIKYLQTHYPPEQAERLVAAFARLEV